MIIALSGFYGIPKLFMKYFLENMIELLLSHKIKVVFRPHPQNLLDDEAIKIKQKFLKHKLFIFDNSENYFKQYLSSTLLITDYSGTAYTYAMITLNPVIFFSYNKKYINILKYNKLNYFKDEKNLI